MRRLTTEEFIRRAQEVHGNKYIYGKVEYIQSRKKVVITCPSHGDFLQTPGNHVNNEAGCPDCTHMSLDDFLDKALKVHGTKYNYSNIQYVNITTLIELECPFCGGTFEIAPHKHLSGYNCPLCARQRQGITRLKDTPYFIQKSKEVHGELYDYSVSNYTGRNQSLRIICPTHGMFEQLAGNHLSGCGCPYCHGRNAKAWDNTSLYVLGICGSTGDFTGFGITCNYKARLIAHKKSLSSNGYFINTEWTTPRLPRALALQLENEIKSVYSLSDLSKNIHGFKTESTDTSFNVLVNFIRSRFLEEGYG